jgi:hypothetical protein
MNSSSATTYSLKNSFSDANICIFVDGHLSTYHTILGPNLIRVEFAENITYNVGSYIDNILLKLPGDSQHKFIGIISKKNTEKSFEIGLFSDIPDNLYLDNSILNEIVAFKRNNSFEEVRKSNRVNLRQEEGVGLVIGVNNLKFVSQIYDLSSFGFSFISDNKYKIGMNLNFCIVLKDKEYRGNAQVTWVSDFKDKFKIGVRFLNFDNTPSMSLKEQVVIKSSHSVIGVFSRIHFFFEKSAFKVLSISSESVVLQIETSDQFILPGMKLDLKFFLSSARFDDIEPTSVIVCSVREGLNKTLIVNCNIDSINSDLSLNISNYMLQFLNASPGAIREAGFDVSKIADAFSFRYVDNHAEYVEVLKLRYATYLAAEKIDKTKSPKDMITSLDSKSRILIVKHQGRIVASAAISFPDSEEIILDTERAIEGGFTKKIPPKKQMIEISRLCTHPDYRKGDMLHRIFEHTYKIFATSGRGYIITSCDDKLWPLYKKLGFKKTELNYKHLALAGLLHHLIIVPIEVGLRVNKVNLLAWSYLYSKMFRDMESRGIVSVSRYTNLKMKFADLLLNSVLRIKNLFS